MSLRYETASPEDDDVAELAGPPTPFPVYTIILIASFLVVMVVQLATGLEASILDAGFVKPAFRSGEYWRLLTGAALHGGILHIAFNSYALYSFGRIMEILTNRAHLPIVFLLACIGGGLLSFVLLPTGISVGASGGVVGLIGYLAVYAFKRKDLISAEFRRSLLTNIAFLLVYGVAMYQTIDNFAHLGGLITGALYGLLQVPRDLYVDPLDAGGSIPTAGLAALGTIVAICIFAILVILHIV